MQDLPLRDYQKEGVEYIMQNHRVILGDEQGLGKTLTTLAALLKLTADARNPQILVFGPSIALGTWAKELKKWFGEDALIYSGKSNPREREAIWHQYQKERPRLLIATYAMAEELLSYNVAWTAIVADEYHRAGLMNYKTGTFKTFAKFRSRFLVLLSGTPVKKGPQNLFAPLHLINSHVFPHYWKYVNKYCIVTQEFFGKTIEPRPKNPTQFKEFIKPYILRRTKKKVLKDLPSLQRQAIELEMTDKQRKYYNQLAEHGILETPNGMILCANEAVKLMRLRQILVSPSIFGFEEIGAGIKELQTQVEDLLDNNEPVAICTPFRPVIDTLEKVLSPLADSVYKIYGAIGDATITSQRFQNDPSKRKIILYTITSGMSWDAYTSSHVFFLGAEWSASDNKQAEARLHRLGQKNAVNAYYMLYPGTIDDAILERLDDNTMAANWVLETAEMLERIEKLKKNP